MRINLPIVFAGVIIGSTLIGAGSPLPALKAERWVNSAPLSSGGLRGKVVLVDFWRCTPASIGFGPCRLSRRGIVTTPRSASS